VERPVIFALTPRAGRWNHRYLVPTDVAWPQDLISQLADEAQKEVPTPNSLRAMRPTLQQTTRRVGPEYLIIRDERLALINEKEREVLGRRPANHRRCSFVL
jgi:hypothetical protein